MAVRTFTGHLLPFALAAICLNPPAHSQDAGKGSQQASNGLAVGQRAPDFSLADATGHQRKLTEFRSKEAVALVFYPAMFRTGGCITELRSLRSAAKELEGAGVAVLGVSWRPVDFNKDLCDKEGINFALLSDPERVVIKQYGVWDEKDNAAKRVTFLIDSDGVIRDIDREVKPEDYGKTLAERAKRVLAK